MRCAVTWCQVLHETVGIKPVGGCFRLKPISGSGSHKEPRVETFLRTVRIGLPLKESSAKMALPKNPPNPPTSSERM